MDIHLTMPETSSPSPAPPPNPAPAVVSPATPVAVVPAPARSVSLTTLVLSVALSAVLSPYLHRLVPAVELVHGSYQIGVVLDWSGLRPTPIPPIVPPVPPPTPAPHLVITGPIHVTLVTDPNDDSQANADLRTALAIHAAFPSLDAFWHHRTTDAEIAAFGLTPIVTSIGKPCVIYQDQTGAVIGQSAKATSEADVIAAVKALRGGK